MLSDVKGLRDAIFSPRTSSLLSQQRLLSFNYFMLIHSFENVCYYSVQAIQDTLDVRYGHNITTQYFTDNRTKAPLSWENIIHILVIFCQIAMRPQNDITLDQTYKQRYIIEVYWDRHVVFSFPLLISRCDHVSQDICGVGVLLEYVSPLPIAPRKGRNSLPAVVTLTWATPKDVMWLISPSRATFAPHTPHV